MTWKKYLVRLVGGMLLLGALALSSGADVWDGAMALTSTTITTVTHHHK